MRETHLSILVFLGDRVLKFRKHRRFDFADFTEGSARAEDCRREVDLNRRLAPDVYLGVADVRLDGETIDHAVVMRRLPPERSLARLVTAGDAVGAGAAIAEVARTLVSFHGRARRSSATAAGGTPTELGRRLDADVAATRRFVGTVLGAEEHDALVGDLWRYLAGRERLFAARIAQRCICDGHGDLQAGDIYCLDDGPRVLDCLEFDDGLRYVDVASDVAFLAMDLERLGCPEQAAAFVREYERASGGSIPPSLLDFYIATRAYVRVKVACLRHEQGDGDAAGEATALLALARAHADRARARLVLVGGLPGSGKTTLAAAIAPRIGARALHSDGIRRERAGPPDPGAAPTPYRGGAYTAEETDAVYRDLLDEADRCLGLGETVLVDASWVDASYRNAARALAARLQADVVELRCVAPEGVCERRIEGRARGGGSLSEATAAVREAMAAEEDPWPSAEVIDTSQTPENAVRQALAALARRGIACRAGEGSAA